MKTKLSMSAALKAKLGPSLPQAIQTHEKQKGDCQRPKNQNVLLTWGQYVYPKAIAQVFTKA